MSQIEIHAALELVLTLRFLRMLAARAYSRAGHGDTISLRCAAHCATQANAI